MADEGQYNKRLIITIQVIIIALTIQKKIFKKQIIYKKKIINSIFII